MTDKHARLLELARRRQASRWEGYKCIGDYHDGAYECDFVSPYTIGTGNIDADLMVLLQDWAGAAPCAWIATVIGSHRCLRETSIQFAGVGQGSTMSRPLDSRHIDTSRDPMVLLGNPSGAIMPDDMGTFRVDIEIENPMRPGTKRGLTSVLVDTGAELSWIPAQVLESLGIERYRRWTFRQADGTILERWTGPAFVYAAGKRATDDVVFGEPGDLVLLGARSLEGLNLRIDPVSRRLVDAGPAPAAATAGV